MLWYIHTYIHTYIPHLGITLTLLLVIPCYQILSRGPFSKAFWKGAFLDFSFFSVESCTRHWGTAKTLWWNYCNFPFGHIIFVNIFIGVTLVNVFFSQEDITKGTARVHSKKRLVIFPSPAGMPLIKLFLAGNNYYSPPGGVCLVTSRLGTGKPRTFVFTV